MWVEALRHRGVRRLALLVGGIISFVPEADQVERCECGDFETGVVAYPLRELLGQLQACSTRGHDIQLKVGARFVRRRGDLLDCYNPALSDST